MMASLSPIDTITENFINQIHSHVHDQCCQSCMRCSIDSYLDPTQILAKKILYSFFFCFMLNEHDKIWPVDMLEHPQLTHLINFLGMLLELEPCCYGF